MPRKERWMQSPGPAIVLLIASALHTGAGQSGAVPDLSLEHRMMLRCSAAFALVAYRQGTGDAEASRYPPLKERGSEFFVRASARVMDEAGLDRAAISAALQAEAHALAQDEALEAVMPACLSVLDAAGL
jgi:hypothetical protein